MSNSLTPAFALPYPNGDALVIEGDDAIEALAKRVEDVINYNASITIGSADSAQAGAGTMVVDFPGALNAGGFSIDGDRKVITYNGFGSRFFIVSAHIEVEGGPAQGFASAAYLLQNNGTVDAASSYDEVQIAAGASLERRKFVHHLTAPVQLSPGQNLYCTVTPSSGATIGITSIRVYPIGPTLA